MIATYGNLDDMVDSAMRMARMHHSGQTYGHLNYMEHLQAVVSELPRADINNSDHYKYAMAVAWLHDILEDTKCTYTQLELEFPKEVCFAVYLLTDPPAPTREIRKALFYAQLREASLFLHDKEFATATWIARIVKLTDRLCNVKHSIEQRNTKKLEMYKAENSKFIHEMGNYKTTAASKLEDLMDTLK